MDYEKEISFGAFDSELMHQEIFIPEGFEATIEGNKITLKKIESEDERIRKLLVEAVTQVLQDQYCSNRGVSKEKVVAWLEKQGLEENKGNLGGISSNSAWSKEDEHRVKDIIYFLDTAKKHYASTEELDACIDWLKFLEERYTWKPSDEQMEALDIATMEVWTIQNKERLSELYQDLKKLREE